MLFIIYLSYNFLIRPLLEARAGIQKYFSWFFGSSESLEFAFETNWPLGTRKKLVNRRSWFLNYGKPRGLLGYPFPVPLVYPFMLWWTLTWTLTFFCFNQSQHTVPLSRMCNLILVKLLDEMASYYWKNSNSQHFWIIL